MCMHKYLVLYIPAIINSGWIIEIPVGAMFDLCGLGSKFTVIDGTVIMVFSKYLLDDVVELIPV